MQQRTPGASTRAPTSKASEANPRRSSDSLQLNRKGISAGQSDLPPRQPQDPRERARSKDSAPWEGPVKLGLKSFDGWEIRTCCANAGDARLADVCGFGASQM